MMGVERNSRRGWAESKSDTNSPLQQSSILFKCFFCRALAGKNEIEIDTQVYSSFKCAD